MCRCGTFRPTNKPAGPPVPLTGVSVEISILGFCAEVTIRQRFENTEADPIEATYEFILEENASVTSFAATIDGRTIEAKLKEKEAAHNTYDDSIASGGGAYLLEQSAERRNAFSVSVGNLPPKKEAIVALSYVSEAAVSEDGLVVFTLPGGQPLKLGAPSAAKSEHAAMFQRPYQIRAAFEMANNIRSITSKTHPITFEFGDAMNKATVSYAPDEPPQTPEDFVLQVKLADPHQPMSRVQLDAAGNSVAMLSFFPKLETDTVQAEMLFLVDRSGSMQGSSISSVKQTLQFFLRSLSEGVLFNIIGFGSSHMALFPKSAQYNDESLRKATEHVASMEADLGGTNVLRPLMEIFATPSVPGTPRQIFLLTDGQVSNSQSCIDAVRANANTTRVFTFGIGNDVDKDLVQGIAKAGEGECELISDASTMNQKVLRQLGRALKPALTDVRIGWGEIGVKQAPNVLPPLFSGSRLVVYGFLAPGTGPSTVTLSGRFGSIPWTGSVAVDPARAMVGSQIVKLGSGAMIRDIEEGRSCLGKLEEAQAKKEALALSLRNGVISKYSAFVAVEHRGEATEGSMQQRAISLAPVSPPSPSQSGISGPGRAPPMLRSAVQRTGCRGRGGYSLSAISRGGPPPPPPTAAACGAPPAIDSFLSFAYQQMHVAKPRLSSMHAEKEECHKKRKKAEKSCGVSDLLMEDEEECLCAPAPAPARRSSSPAAASVMDIVTKQRANGSWNPESLLLIGITPDAAAKSVPIEAAGKADADAVWATFLIVAYLRAKHAGSEVEWGLIAKKALKWAMKTGANAAPGLDWEAEAATFISKFL